MLLPLAIVFTFWSLPACAASEEATCVEGDFVLGHFCSQSYSSFELIHKDPIVLGPNSQLLVTCTMETDVVFLYWKGIPAVLSDQSNPIEMENGALLFSVVNGSYDPTCKRTRVIIRNSASYNLHGKLTCQDTDSDVRSPDLVASVQITEFSLDTHAVVYIDKVKDSRSYLLVSCWNKELSEVEIQVDQSTPKKHSSNESCLNETIMAPGAHTIAFDAVAANSQCFIKLNKTATLDEGLANTNVSITYPFQDHRANVHFESSVSNLTVDPNEFGCNAFPCDLCIDTTPGEDYVMTLSVRVDENGTFVEIVTRFRGTQAWSPTESSSFSPTPSASVVVRTSSLSIVIISTVVPFISVLVVIAYL